MTHGPADLDRTPRSQEVWREDAQGLQGAWIPRVAHQGNGSKTSVSCFLVHFAFLIMTLTLSVVDC